MVKSGFIFKVELTGSADNQGMGCGRPREGFKAHLGPFMEIRKIGGGTI